MHLQCRVTETADVPNLAAPLFASTGGDSLSDAMLDMMMNLPRVPEAVKPANHFADRGRLETFLQTYRPAVLPSIKPLEIRGSLELVLRERDLNGFDLSALPTGIAPRKHAIFSAV